MAQIYGTKKETPAHCVMDDASLLATGKLIRAFAKIEHAVDVYLAAACAINGSHMTLLVSRSPISKKLEIGAYLAGMRGDEEKESWAKIFNTDFWELLRCRNTLAHGVLLGVDGDGLYSLLTSNTDIPQNGTAIQLVRGFHPDFIANMSAKAEYLADNLPDFLSLKTSFDRSLQGPLLPHRKAQKKTTRGDKAKRPPRS
ncbi:MAG: hypothetical protein V3V15_07495 [Sphingorhabdus sp.]